jgi:hypothetical protein
VISQACDLRTCSTLPSDDDASAHEVHYAAVLVAWDAQLLEAAARTAADAAAVRTAELEAAVAQTAAEAALAV